MILDPKIVAAHKACDEKLAEAIAYRWIGHEWDCPEIVQKGWEYTQAVIAEQLEHEAQLRGGAEHLN